MMKLTCPACGHLLTEMTAGDIVVDVCKGGCGGIWFDNFELRKVDEKHEHQGEILLDIERIPEARVDREAKRPCPRCGGVVMMRRYFSVKRKVEIDECPSCGGIWLDAGELRDIRSEFENEKERRAAFDRYFNDVFGDKIQQDRQGMQEGLEQARSSISAFRYICPSYWTPGEQKWGAF